MELSATFHVLLDCCNVLHGSNHRHFIARLSSHRVDCTQSGLWMIPTLTLILTTVSKSNNRDLHTFPRTLLYYLYVHFIWPFLWLAVDGGGGGVDGDAQFVLYNCAISSSDHQPVSQSVNQPSQSRIRFFHFFFNYSTYCVQLNNLRV